MKRDPGALARGAFDLLVIGGGVSGACIAWDAVLRGLSVALVEKDDFGHATSSASSKIVHGGIRYLQQGLVGKVRQSVRERTAFLRIAPHLVHPVPFVVPTYGHGLRGKEILAAGMTVYDLLTRVRNDVDDPAKQIPAFRMLSVKDILGIAPEVPPRDLTGGVVYHDAQMHSSERMTLSFLLSAASRGAEVANYVEATRLLVAAGRVAGVAARDRLGGGDLEIRARVVVSATGPWVFRVGMDGPLAEYRRQMVFSKGVHVLTREIHPTHALALATRLANEAIVNRGGRHIFLIPWRGHTLIGTTNVPFPGEADSLAATETDIEDFLVEINRAWPAARLTRDDVRFAYAGLYQLFGEGLHEGVFKSSSNYRIFDHERDGLPGLVTALGARFTTARKLAADCVDLTFRKLGHKPPPCETANTPVRGGEIGRSEEFFAAETERLEPRIGAPAARELLRSYGTRAGEVLALADLDPSLAAPLPGRPDTLRAVVVHAVREEMAQTLVDVCLRRTGIGTLGDPGEACLGECAAMMAAELGWDDARIESELSATRRAVRLPFR